MNESQERREELLRMSRQKWRKGSIPAVHPRYQHVYRGLYGEHSSEENGGSSFFARMFISFLQIYVIIGINRQGTGISLFPVYIYRYMENIPEFFQRAAKTETKPLKKFYQIE